MPYETWTNADIDKYKYYASKIKSEYVGSFSISGIYKKDDPYRSRAVRASIHRVYDGNNYCSDRNSLQTDASQSIKVEGGKIKGLVVLIEKDSDTGSFFDIGENSERISAAAAWIAAHYKGGASTVAKHIVTTHQGVLHEGCFTVDEQGKRGPVLNSTHLRTIIIPAATSAFKDSIASADRGMTSYYDSGLVSNESQELIVDELKTMLGEGFTAENAKISFVPAEENVKQEHAVKEEQEIVQPEHSENYSEIMNRLVKKEVPVEPTNPVAPDVFSQQ